MARKRGSWRDHKKVRANDKLVTVSPYNIDYMVVLSFAAGRVDGKAINNQTKTNFIHRITDIVN
jgi:hypothetical protein